MDATNLELKPSPTAGFQEKKFFQTITDLAEKTARPLTESIKLTIKAHPRTFAAYLLEIGAISASQAAQMDGGAR